MGWKPCEEQQEDGDSVQETLFDILMSAVVVQAMLISKGAAKSKETAHKTKLFDDKHPQI